MSESIATATRHLVFRVAKLGRSPRLMLDAIADRADGAGRAWPSERLLAASTDMSVRGVRDAVRELEDRGILKITRRGWHQSNIYEIQLRVLAELPRIGADQPGNGCRPDDDRPANPEAQTGKNPQTDRQPLPPKLPRGSSQGKLPIQDGADAHAWLSLLNAETSSSFKATDGNLRPIRARQREGFTLDQAKTVVKAKNREWRGTDWAKHLNPHTLYGPKFDGYLQAALNGNGHDPRRVNDSWDVRPDGVVDKEAMP